MTKKSNAVDDLVPELRKQSRLAQKKLFESLAPKMLGVCRSYVSDLQHAEDCMLRGFVKSFKNIASLQCDAKIFAWIRKIMVNECLDYLKQKKSWLYLEENNIAYEFDETISNYSSIDAQELLDKLPESHRIIFNLFVLEDYSHKEIALKLNISESASKTTLKRAKVKLKQLIVNQVRQVK